MTVSLESAGDIIGMPLGDSSERKVDGYITMKSPNDGYMKAIRWLHENVTLWLVTKQPSRWIHSGVIQWRRLENNNKMNKIFHILVYHSNSYSCDITVSSHRLTVILWEHIYYICHLNQFILTITLNFCKWKLGFYVCSLIYGHWCISC